MGVTHHSGCLCVMSLLLSWCNRVSQTGINYEGERAFCSPGEEEAECCLETPRHWSYPAQPPPTHILQRRLWPWWCRVTFRNQESHVFATFALTPEGKLLGQVPLEWWYKPEDIRAVASKTPPCVISSRAPVRSSEVWRSCTKTCCICPSLGSGHSSHSFLCP